ncbi:hemolysin-III related [Aquisphaera giovannonii]|uniref:Hemolysin-III related n=1 Tax=Aquisphaera giovannonii TaxID=406548 RepID=A0A5B9W5D8_9BACT|nr:hemolysin III family protein [Aquisphaera giovannonii]QEH35349.1 hemolysin-III related [Aquisphaera giovannonii]
MGFLHFREPVNAWSHGIWMLLALPGLVLLWRRGRGSAAMRATLLIYGLTLVFCSGVSMLFHGVRDAPATILALDRLDHIGIFLLIAGTYTPIAWALLRRRWRLAMLATVWACAAAGIAMHLTWPVVPRGLSTGLYLGMGWLAIVCYLEVARRVSQRALLPLVIGGILYSLGALFNLLHFPVIWPGVFQSHELFHVLVVAASVCHFYFIITVAGVAALEMEREPRAQATDPAARRANRPEKSQA